MVYNFGPFLPNLQIMTSQKNKYTRILKSNIRIRFDLLKSKWLTLYQSPLSAGGGDNLQSQILKRGWSEKKKWEPGVSEHVLATDICLGGLVMFFVQKDFVKWNMVLRAQFSNVSLDLFKLNNQLMYSFVTFWFCLTISIT